MPANRRAKPDEQRQGKSPFALLASPPRGGSPVVLSVPAAARRPSLGRLGSRPSRGDRLVESTLRAAVVLTNPVSCAMCGALHTPFELQAISIESLDEGWLAHGKGQQFIASCPMCGATYQAVRNTIPIHCASLPCPRCGDHQELDVDVKRVEVNSEAVEFEAILRCRRCAKRKSVRKVINSILGAVKIKVGPDGISVESG